MQGFGPSEVTPHRQSHPTPTWVWLQAGSSAHQRRMSGCGRVRWGLEGRGGASSGPHTWGPAHSQRCQWKRRSQLVVGAEGLSPAGCGLPGLGPPGPSPGQSPGTRQAATRGELATKAYSSRFKKVFQHVQLSFTRCSGMFPLRRLYLADKGLILGVLIMAWRPQCKQSLSVCSMPPFSFQGNTSQVPRSGTG